MSTYPDLHLYINGEWRKTASDLPVLNPATEEVIGRLAHATTSDLDDALDAAEKGFTTWSRTAPVHRANVLLKAAAIMRERQEEIATAITQEHGSQSPPQGSRSSEAANFSNGTPAKRLALTGASSQAPRAFVTSFISSRSAR